MFQLQPGEKRGILNFYKSAPQTDGIPVNPKGYFANERTFLHWLSMNLVLGGLGVGLLNFGGLNAQISGVLFCLVSLYFAGYSLIQYHKRADLLANKAKGVDYEDMNGILALIFVVSIAIVINFAFNFTNK